MNYAGNLNVNPWFAGWSPFDVESALQHVSMFIRSTNNTYQIIEPLFDLGMWLSMIGRQLSVIRPFRLALSEKLLSRFENRRYEGWTLPSDLGKSSAEVKLEHLLVSSVIMAWTKRWKRRRSHIVWNRSNQFRFVFRPLLVTLARTDSCLASVDCSHRRSLRQWEWYLDSVSFLSARDAQRLHSSGNWSDGSGNRLIWERKF